MAVTREDVVHVAGLARLRLTEEEIERFTVQLSGILQHMEELKELDVSGVEPVGGAAEWQAPLRSEDAGPDGLSRELRELAPAWQDGFFTVPRLAALDTGDLEGASEDQGRLAGRPTAEGSDS
jgi:aspartyl-tRNA(Asn)/glutamyl-tRNA(Gln) amidotransferase subunit C